MWTPTDEQKRKWRKNYVTRRQREGWKFVGWQLPEEIATKLTALKCRLMADFKAAQQNERA
jgi:hypothetical protein